MKAKLKLLVSLSYIVSITCALHAATYFLQSMGGADGSPPWPFNPEPSASVTKIRTGVYVVNDTGTTPDMAGGQMFTADDSGPPDPTDPGEDSTNAAPDGSGVTNCMCCSYPTNVTLRWFLDKGVYNMDWGSSLTLAPDGILYSPSVSTPASSPNLIGLVSDTDTNTPGYAVIQSAPGSSSAPVLIAPDGSIIINAGNVLVNDDGLYGADQQVMSYDPTLTTNNWTIDLLADDYDDGDSAMAMDDAGTIYVPSRTTIMALTNAPGLTNDYQYGHYYWSSDQNPLPRATNVYSLNGVGIKWIFSYPDAFMAHSNLIAYPQIYDSGFFRAGPIVDTNGTLYVNTIGGQLLALNATNGTLKWATPFMPPVPAGSLLPATAPVIGTNGVIYFGMNTAFYAVDPAAPITNYCMGFKYYYTNWNQVFALNPIVGGDGTVYAESAGNGSYNVSMWDYNLPEYEGPTSTTNALFAFNPQLAVKWVNYMSTQTGAEYHTDVTINETGRTGSLALAADGELYLADWDGTFYSLCAATGSTNYATNIISMLPNNEVEAEMHSPLIAPDGTVYVDALSEATVHDYIFAFAGPSPLACAPWPEDRKNNRRAAYSRPLGLAGHLSAPGMKTNGFQLHIDAPTNAVDCLCGTADFVTWTNIAQLWLTNGGTDFIDTGATNYPWRFYAPFPQ